MQPISSVKNILTGGGFEKQLSTTDEKCKKIILYYLNPKADRSCALDALKHKISQGWEYSGDVGELEGKINRSPYLLREDKHLNLLTQEEATKVHDKYDPNGKIEKHIKILKSGDTSRDAKKASAEALVEMAKNRMPLSKEAIERLTFDFSSTKFVVACTLEEVTKGKLFQAKKVIEGLTGFLKSADTDFSAKYAIAKSLGEVAKGGTPLPKEALEVLTGVLKSADTASSAKYAASGALGTDVMSFVGAAGFDFASVACSVGDSTVMVENTDAFSKSKSLGIKILEEITQGGKPLLLEEEVEGLIEVLKSADTDDDIKSLAARVLGEIAQEGKPLPKEALKVLISLLF